MAQLDGVVLTFTVTIMVFSSLQPPLACSGASSDLRPLDVRVRFVSGVERSRSVCSFIAITKSHLSDLYQYCLHIYTQYPIYI